MNDSIAKNPSKSLVETTDDMAVNYFPEIILYKSGQF